MENIVVFNIYTYYNYSWSYWHLFFILISFYKKCGHMIFMILQMTLNLQFQGNIHSDLLEHASMD